MIAQQREHTGERRKKTTNNTSKRSKARQADVSAVDEYKWKEEQIFR